MPSFKPLAADASPATSPAATRAVVPYRTFLITKVPFSSSEPTALGAASVRLLEPPKSWAPSWPRQRTRKEFDALNGPGRGANALVLVADGRHDITRKSLHRSCHVATVELT